MEDAFSTGFKLPAATHEPGQGNKAGPRTGEHTKKILVSISEQIGKAIGSSSISWQGPNAMQPGIFGQHFPTLLM